MISNIQSDLDTTRGLGVANSEKISAYNGGPRSMEVDQIFAPKYMWSTLVSLKKSHRPQQEPQKSSHEEMDIESA